MKAINMIEEVIKEVSLFELSKEKRIAMDHLKKAIVQINIRTRKKRTEDKKKVEEGHG